MSVTPSLSPLSAPLSSLPRWRHRAQRLWHCSTPGTVFVVVSTLAGASVLAWAAWAKVDVIVRAEGRVIPAGKPQIVQHLEGGIVAAILVREGQSVKAGQPLMEIGDARAKADVGSGRSRLLVLRAREARLLAESQGRGQIDFPTEVTDPAVRHSELQALQARRGRQGEEVAVLRSQSRQKEAEIAEAQSRVASQSSEIEVARRQLSVLEGLRAKGAASQLEVLEAQSKLQRLTSVMEDARNSVPRLRAAVAEMRSRMQESDAKVRAEASAELTQVRGDIDRIVQEVGAGEDRLGRTMVVAPRAGVINRLNVATIGGVVRPGEAVLEITPDSADVVMEGKVKPNDRASLQPGQGARVRVGAFDYATYGVIEARVTEVSADTLADDRGERYYRLRLDAPAQPGLLPQPGMTAQADVVVGRRTILSYLLSPLMRFRDAAFRDPR